MSYKSTGNSTFLQEKRTVEGGGSAVLSLYTSPN